MEPQLTPEDREALARMKFGTWFDEFFSEKFAAAFDGRLNEYAELSGNSSSTVFTTQSGKHAPDNKESKQRRRSLLDIALTETLGI